jgi:hypothetical protein
MHPDSAIALATEIDADRRRRALARHQTHAPRQPRARALREAVGYRLVVTGWRLLDGVSATGAPPARTGDPRPA